MRSVGDFQLEQRMTRYSQFIPRLYNFCLSLGFEPGRIMPSRAFCSDENQGFPIILIAKHFGTFPFNHGRVGGIVATDRHGPHAHHGQDMVIIQASHVGYDPDTEQFGSYRRLQTSHCESTSDCGKIAGVSSWYLSEYHFACENILVKRRNGEIMVTIDNQLLDGRRQEGLVLCLESMVQQDEQGEYLILRALSTSKMFLATAAFAERFSLLEEGEAQVIGSALSAELFSFERNIQEAEEGHDHLERNLLPYMPQIVTTNSPALIAAQINSQVEFDRAFRTITQDPAYHGKRLLFISGINIDISPRVGQIFPLTKFVPWAAYFQDSDGSRVTYEQDELWELLSEQSTDNPDQIDLDGAIQQMEYLEEVVIESPGEQ
ncbi:MAG: hypothetical protein H8D24_02145 [Gammaproteobacteria bacterium]|uniref:Limiting CO2-inducible protein B/C beta carbonyic anhydrase domain-containing protein n=1 Tax=Candidatus Thiopontia autotrophica TaxID=2841688 RepID=A0A8J6TS38_9GAMM|nr:hypothetical protein [Candidatus Thiopontia autotrophica]MBL6969253.1 hypothetical protein [Gammaproteobacteria bacterium]